MPSDQQIMNRDREQRIVNDEVHPEQQYLELLQLLIDQGDERVDRTGVGTRAVFGHQMRFNLGSGFPVFTTKQLYWKTAFKEMLWMLSGGDNLSLIHI